MLRSHSFLSHSQWHPLFSAFSVSCKMLHPFRPKLNLAKMLPQYNHLFFYLFFFRCKSSFLVKYMMRWTVLLDNLPHNCQGRGWKDCCCGNFQEFLVLNQCFASGRSSFHVWSLYCNLPTLAETENSVFCRGARARIPFYWLNDKAGAQHSKLRDSFTNLWEVFYVSSRKRAQR